MLTIEKVILDITKVIKDNRLSLPTNVAEYDKVVKLFAKKHHRATLTKNGISCKEVLKAINPEYEMDKRNIHGMDVYRNHAKTIGLTAVKVDKDIPDKEFTRKCLLIVTCRKCAFQERITAASLIRRKNGCKKCVGSANWKYREKEFIGICKSKNIVPIYEDFILLLSNGLSTLVNLKCSKCYTHFSRTFSTIIKPKDSANCPTCKPNAMYGSMGTSTFFNGIEFDSTIEMLAYQVLVEKYTNVQVHVNYSALGVKDSKLVADFLVNNTVIEVSSFNLKEHTSYKERIDLKRSLIKQNTNLNFVFCNTLAEVRKLVEENLIN